MSANMPISEHVSNPSRLRRWRIVNVGLLLIPLFLPWIATSCDAHVSKAGYEVLTQYYIFYDGPLVLLSLALPAYVLANVLMTSRVPFQRKPWLTVPVWLAFCSVAFGCWFLALLLDPSRPAPIPPGEIVLLCWIVAGPLYARAYSLIGSRISQRRKAWFRLPFALYMAVVVPGVYFVVASASPTNPIHLTDFAGLADITALIACAAFSIANTLMALEVPLQRRSWLLAPLALCVFGAVGGIWFGYTLDMKLKLMFGADVFLLGLVSAVMLELYEVRAVRHESTESRSSGTSRMVVEGEISNDNFES